MRGLVRSLAFAAALLLPSLVLAQSASLTGTVRDTSGAVLPGVTVEVSSPVLIEKVRSSTTDGSGQWRITELRPGLYTVTFTLAGFSTVRRDGIELTGSATLAIPAELRVGSLEETITVTGETPIVDVQSIRRQVVVDSDVLKSIPSSQSYAGIFTLIPAATTASNDMQVVPGMIVFGGAGGRANEGRMQLDGLNTGAAFNGAGVSSYLPDIGNAQEVTMSTSGGLGEAEVGGPTLSIVPRTGGNNLAGSVYLAGVTEGMVDSNYTDRHRELGLLSAGGIESLWDFNLGIGGPVKRDRIWFWAQARDEGSYYGVPSMWANKNAGDPTKWLYEADLSRPARQAGSWRTLALRLTSQVTQKHKINLFWDEQHPCHGGTWSSTVGEGCRTPKDDEVLCSGRGTSNPSCSRTAAPETSTYLHPYGQRVQQVTWTAPQTNRLLFEAGFGTYLSRWGGNEIPGSPTRSLVRVTEQCTAGCANNGGIANLTYRSGNWAANWQGTHSWRAAASYVTGAQSMKFGYIGGWLVDNSKNYTNDNAYSIRVNNGIPNQITQTITPIQVENRARYDSFYAQEQWTLNRLTLQGALRYDRMWSWHPESIVGPVRFLPTQIVYPETKSIDSWQDVSPRGGAAYDLFGTGKTAIKVNAGKYLQAAQTGGTANSQRPGARLTTTTTRTWTDNGNYIPDCDLLNPDEQNNLATGGDRCAAIGNRAFGSSTFTGATDPALLSGWGIRPGDWQFGASIQQEVLPRISVEVGYNLRWLTNFTATDNLAQGPGDFTAYSVTAPQDPRLPDGGGYVISGLYNANPGVADIDDDFTTFASRFGDQYSRYNGVLVNISARPRNGLTFQGGINYGRTTADSCEVRASLPENASTNPYCHTSTRTSRYTGLASYIVPKVDVLVSATFRSDQGPGVAANYNVPNAAIVPSLGRNLSNNAQFVTVNLIEPGTMYWDRINELNVRFAKILRFGRTRSNVGVDIFNIINSDVPLGYQGTFVPNNPGIWGNPTSIITPRFVKFSATVDF